MEKAVNQFINGQSGKISVRSKGIENSKSNDIIVMVQGANISGQLGFDFSFPKGKDYSFMDAMVSEGIGAITFSIRGYAESELSGSPLEVQTDQAIEDLVSVVEWLRTKENYRINLLGWSWGGRIVGRYAEKNSDKIHKLILLDPALGGGQLILPAPKEEWWNNSYNYYFNRLEDEFTELDARKALAKQAETNEPKSPNGIRQENALGSIPVEPKRIKNSTLMLYGSSAGAQDYMKGSSPRTEFFEKLDVNSKSLSVISGGGDYAHLQDPRQEIHKIVADFTTQT